MPSRSAPGTGIRRGSAPVASSSRSIAEFAAVVEGDPRAARVQPGHRGVGDQLDVVVAVEGLGMDERLLPWGLPAQVVLGQRRALVGSLGLCADQHQPAVEALIAQRLRGAGAGEAGADDHERLSLLAHWSLLVVRARNSWRVRGSSRTSPCRAEVTVLAPNFCTPRSDMHKCSASSTTPTPLG